MASVAEIFESMAWGPAPEAPDPAYAWLDQHGRRFGHYVDGQWRDADETFEVSYPANRQRLASVGQGCRADIDAAVKSARSASSAWSQTPGHQRARYLYALARQVQKHARLLAVLESLDTGKPIRESRDLDIPLVARHFAYHAGWAQIAERELAEYQPIGVVGQIIPWNFPLLMLAWKVAPALAMGNTVVVVPSEQHPLSAIDLYQVLETSDVPPGVLNIVTGERDPLARVLAEHDDVDGVWYVGTAEGRRQVEAASAGNMKRTWTSLQAEFSPGPHVDQDRLRDATHVKNIWLVHA
jgi:aldehyde dehydrogenase (NAD+)